LTSQIVVTTFCF